MPQRSTTHATFVIERTLAATPERVFAAYANPANKARWFGGPEEWDKSDYQLDFRPGGRESISGGPPGGTVHRYDALYWDIVVNERIVVGYEMHLDATRISVSLGTTELLPQGSGTRLIYTEQGVFLDGYDDAGSRERGTRELLDNLATFLTRVVPS
ncbi:MAG: SRPBCC family protein [Hyphomonadaceae bacterium]|nr:SRPBCC family protein [Hyphomonadaceae bacterium]